MDTSASTASTTSGRIAQLSVPLAQASQQYADAAPYTQPDELHLQAPDGNAGLYLRNDGVAEIYAGAARLVIDSETGSLILNGTHVLNLAQEVSLDVARGGLSVARCPFRWEWLTRKPLAEIAPGMLAKIFVKTDPSPTTPAVPLSKFVNARPLFDPERDANDLRSHLSGLLQMLP